MNLGHLEKLQAFHDLGVHLVDQNYRLCFVYHQHKQYSQNLYVVDKLGTLPIYLETFHEKLISSLSLQPNLQSSNQGHVHPDEINQFPNLSYKQVLLCTSGRQKLHMVTNPKRLTFTASYMPALKNHFLVVEFIMTNWASLIFSFVYALDLFSCAGRSS